ncbi:MAG: hypothetical protein FJ026_11250, partial [Chloroflexi bacterium]|nr:hypothetical protein [Chloroflexota bacterium]
MNYKDPVTGDAVQQEENNQKFWEEVSKKLPSDLPRNDLSVLCQALYVFLDRSGKGEGGKAPAAPICKHAPDSYLPDHLLLTSAIAYCLAYEAGLRSKELLIVRLAALAHEFPADDRDALLGGLVGLSDDERAWLCGAWKKLWEQGEALATDRGLNAWQEAKPWNEDPRSRCLWQAHLAASGSLYNHTVEGADGELIRSIGAREDFDRHPLHRHCGQVGLAYGGATKIKGYVFESAKLPEIRGASALFDRINLLDLPALWGAVNEMSPHVPVFVQAPECVIYASGGNILALAPVGKAQALADAIEERYTTQTLVGNSVAVWDAFSLLELQYGRKPNKFWLEEFQEGQKDNELRKMLEGYYEGLERKHFLAKKTFGELVTQLASQANRRRAGLGDGDDKRREDDRRDRRRYVPHYELLPHNIKCGSCDVRAAVVPFQIPEARIPAGQSPSVFCEPCARKRVTGQVAKWEHHISEDKTDWFRKAFPDWWPYGIQPWEERLERFLREHPDRREKYYENLPDEVEANLPSIDKDGLKPGARKKIQDILGIPDKAQRCLTLVDYLEHHKDLELLVAANDLGEIGHASSPNRFVGLIYADGNNVGSMVARISSPARYRQFSRRLYQATEEAVLDALAEHLQPKYVASALDPERPDREKMWVHPFEIITIGGDDLILIVPGDKALPIAQSIGERLEETLGCHACEGANENRYSAQRYHHYDDEGQPTFQARGYEPQISLSAGVVVAAENTPIYFLWGLAEQLIRSAKRQAKELKRSGYKGGTVDFMILK